MKCVVSLYGHCPRGGDVKACLHGLGHFFPRPNGQFLVLGELKSLAGMVCALVSSYWQCQKTDEKIGSERYVMTFCHKNKKHHFCQYNANL